MVNTFTGFQKKVEESFHRESLIAGRFSPDYTFSGVKTVKVITPTTVAMTDYTRSGANRYGTPTELQDTVQELTLTQDTDLVAESGGSARETACRPGLRSVSAQ